MTREHKKSLQLHIYSMRPKDIKQYLSMTIACLLFSLSSLLYAEKVSVWLNPAVVGPSQPVTLTISVESSNDGKPDLSVLEKDFQILHRSNSSSISMSNGGTGGTKIRRDWDVVLLPRNKGHSVIPSIRIGDAFTTSLTVEVSDKKASFNDSDEDIFIEMEASPKKLYVQGQIILTQRLYYAVSIDNANLSAPVIKDDTAEIIQLSTSPSYKKEIKGRQYTVVDRTYALFPKYSGDITIEPVEFRAMVSNAQKATHLDSFTMFSKRHSVNILSKPLTLSIEAQADGSTAAEWIPASNISLHGSWSTPIDQLKAGEPVTLTLGINSNGLRASSIPAISFDVPDGIKMYPEKAKFSGTKTSSGIAGDSIQRITFIPTSGGDFYIPEVRLFWWDTVTDQQQEAVFDAVTFEVSGSPAMAHAKGEGESEQGSVLALGSEPEDVSSVSSYPWWLMLLSTGLLGFIAFGTYRFQKAKQESKALRPKSEAEIQQDHAQILIEVHRSCKSANPERTRAALLEWAKEIAHVHPVTLASIGKINPAFASEIDVLSHVLYSKKKRSWNGYYLWTIVKKYQADGASIIGKESILQDLHPKV